MEKKFKETTKDKICFKLNNNKKINLNWRIIIKIKLIIKIIFLKWNINK